MSYLDDLAISRWEALYLDPDYGVDCECEDGVIDYCYNCDCAIYENDDYYELSGATYCVSCVEKALR